MPRHRRRRLPLDDDVVFPALAPVQVRASDLEPVQVDLWRLSREVDRQLEPHQLARHDRSDVAWSYLGPMLLDRVPTFDHDAQRRSEADVAKLNVNDTALRRHVLPRHRVLPSLLPFGVMEKDHGSFTCLLIGTRQRRKLPRRAYVTARGERERPRKTGERRAAEAFYRDVARAGYRGAYLRSLAADVAGGTLDLEALNDPGLPDDEVAASLLALPGCGPTRPRT